VSSVGSCFSYVNDARSHEPEYWNWHFRLIQFWMWKSAFVGIYQLLNWKMQGETLKSPLTLYFTIRRYITAETISNVQTNTNCSPVHFAYSKSALNKTDSFAVCQFTDCHSGKPSICVTPCHLVSKYRRFEWY